MFDHVVQPAVPEDGNIYHLTEEERKVVEGAAQWRFEDAGTSGGDKYYYILDRQHGAALSAGDTKDNNTYSIKDYRGRDNCKWIAGEQGVENGLISFVFTDRKHKLDLVAGGVEAKSETKIGFEYEHRWGERNTRTVSNELTWTVPVAVPPRSVVEVNGVLIRLNKDVPFTAKIENTLGDGRKKIIYVDGIWTGVEYVSGDITFDQVQ